LLFSDYGAPIYRLRCAITMDSYGSPHEDWSAPYRHRLPGARVQDVSNNEVEGIERRLIRGERLLFVPGRCDLTDDDRVDVGGEIWRVSAYPTVRVGLASAVYTTATLVRVSS
jgi:head-tail adaptor